MPNQGLAFWPSIQFVRTASFTLSTGISPSAASIECVPQGDLPQKEGTLVFNYGGITLSFPGCTIDQQSISRDEKGLIWGFRILGRRGGGRVGGMRGRA